MDRDPTMRRSALLDASGSTSTRATCLSTERRLKNPAMTPRAIPTPTHGAPRTSAMTTPATPSATAVMVSRRKSDLSAPGSRAPSTFTGGSQVPPHERHRRRGRRDAPEHEPDHEAPRGGAQRRVRPDAEGDEHPDSRCDREAETHECREVRSEE